MELKTLTLIAKGVTMLNAENKHPTLLRLRDIIGNKDKGIPAIVPVGRSTWLAGVKSGRYPKPCEKKLGVKGLTVWRYEDVITVVNEITGAVACGGDK